MRYWSWVIGLLGLLGLAVVLSVSIGAVEVPFPVVLKVVGAHLTGAAPTDAWSPAQDRIVWVFRLPRVLLAIVVGAALSVSGVTLQAVTRNPLADPYVFGVSYGATVGAVLVLSLGATVTGGLSRAVGAFLGALGATFLVFLFAQQGGRTNPLRLVLAGGAVSYVLSALTSYLVLPNSSPTNKTISTVLAWLAGSLAGAEWGQLGLPTAVTLAATAYLFLQARALNALLMGDESAAGLGLHVDQFRLQLFGLTSLIVGVVVALSGAIGFVGLMIPHLVRLVVGSDHRRVLPLALIGGAIFLVLMDLVGRVAVAPQELPVGIVSAALGGPFFLWLLRRRQTFGDSR